MKVRHVLAKIRKAIMIGNSKHKLRKVFKKAKKSGIDNSYDWYCEKNIVDKLTDDFANSFKNKYKGLFAGDGIGKYLDYTNPTDLHIQFLSKRYYGPENMEERGRLLKETLPNVRTHYEKKTDKQRNKLIKQLIKNKKATMKIAFDKGHAWSVESALKGIKRNGNQIEEYSLRFNEEMTKQNH